MGYILECPTHVIARNTPLTTGHAVRNEPYRGTAFGGAVSSGWSCCLTEKPTRNNHLGPVNFYLTHACRKFQFGNHSDLFNKNTYFKVSKRKINAVEKRGFWANDWYFTEIYIISMFSQSFFSLFCFALLFCIWLFVACARLLLTWSWAPNQQLFVIFL